MNSSTRIPEREKVEIVTKSRRSEDDQWGSRLAFYFAAVGSAVGFGNVWRFPALTVEYGGGAFFVPYFMAFALIGQPILALEIALGQYWQNGDVGVFGRFNQRLAGVGMASIACGFMLIVYYSMLISWVVNAFFDTWQTDIWTDPAVTGDDAVSYFFNEIIGMETVGADLTATRLVWKNVGYSALTWFSVWLCLAFGTRWTGRFTYYTAGIPFALLFVFLGKAVTLPGSSHGITLYIGEWDFSVLTDRPEVWSLATTQIFFSLSITFGVMTAYASHCPRNEPAYVNSAIIASTNSLFSVIAGFAVFATIGHLAYVENKEVTDIDFGGFSLVFGTWPVVLGKLPGGIHWVRLLFLDLFLLGIDSAFSLVEAVIAVVMDTKRFARTPKWKLAACMSLLGWLLSLMYATDAGLFWLDCIDYYVNFVMIIVGLFETIGAGWIYGLSDQIDNVGIQAILSWMILANLLPISFGCALWYGLEEKAALGGFLAFLLSSCLGTLITGYFLYKRLQREPSRWTWLSIWWETTFGNIFRLKNILEGVVQPIPSTWAFLIKGFIPHALIVLFVNGATAENDDGTKTFGNYGGYQTKPFQIMGISVVVFTICVGLIGVVAPKVYAPFTIADNGIAKEFQQAENHLLNRDPNYERSKRGYGKGNAPKESAPSRISGRQSSTTRPQSGYAEPDEAVEMELNEASEIMA